MTHAVVLAGFLVQAGIPRASVTFDGGIKVSVEVVADEPSRQRGLMFREQLGPQEGMIFVFSQEGYYPFWMKNTLIPLDIVWLDPEGTVLAVARSVQPCRADPCPSYAPRNGSSAVDNALYVVEVNAGFVDRHNVRVGGRVVMEGIPPRGKE